MPLKLKLRYGFLGLTAKAKRDGVVIPSAATAIIVKDMNRFIRTAFLSIFIVTKCG